MNESAIWIDIGGLRNRLEEKEDERGIFPFSVWTTILYQSRDMDGREEGRLSGWERKGEKEEGKIDWERREEKKSIV